MTPVEIFDRFKRMIDYEYGLSIPENITQSHTEASWEIDPRYAAKAFEMVGVNNDGGETYPELKKRPFTSARIYVGMNSHDRVTVSMSCDYSRLYAGYNANQTFVYLGDFDNSTVLKVWAKYEELQRSISDDGDLLDILDI